MKSWQQSSSIICHRRDVSVAQVIQDVDIPGHLRTGNVLSLPRKYLSSEVIAITEAPLPDLLSSLASGAVSAVAVAQAFLRRAAIAQKLVNCIHELLPERAIARAKELDEIRTKTGKPVGPLHGLPISVKAHVGIQGCDLSCGLVAWAGEKSGIDAALVKILLDAGAILYARTTEPQVLMMLETRSNITGVTVNPHNALLTPGGSSGGESALQALRGSLLGIGSDIGGSIRSPAASTGIYGLKPTSARLPLLGINAYNAGLETVPGTLGPMSTSLEGLQLFMKTVLDSEPWISDPSLHQIPWRELPPATKKLTIGVLWDDGYVKPSPPIRRALSEVVEKLSATGGFEVIEWKPYKQQDAIALLAKLYSPDGGEKLDSLLALSGEPIDPLISWVMKDQDGCRAAQAQSEVWGWTKEREVFRWEFLQEWNKITPDMDVILCPAGPLPACRHGTSRYWGYTSLWNMLDYPAVVFPVTQVNASDKGSGNRDPYNDIDRFYRDNYNVEEQIGMPVNLQLVAKKLNDEKLLQSLTMIKEVIGLPFVDCVAV